MVNNKTKPVIVQIFSVKMSVKISISNEKNFFVLPFAYRRTLETEVSVTDVIMTLLIELSE